MTREEQLACLEDRPCAVCKFHTDGCSRWACDVEESQPCEDAISRAEIIHTLNTMDRYVADELTLCDTSKKYPKNEVFIVDDVYELVAENLSSVTPKYTDEEIQKMQELEQAQLEKAYELGMQTSFEEWLNSFNTDSATECFTAVQELKKRLEGDDDRN